MNQKFVVDTISLAAQWAANPAGLLAAGQEVGIMELTPALLLAQVQRVRAAATAGSQVAAWVWQAGGGSVLAGAAAELPIAIAATAGGAGAGAATVSSLAPVATSTTPVVAGGAPLVATVAVGALALAALAALIYAGSVLVQVNRDADVAEGEAQHQEGLLDEARDEASEDAAIENAPLPDDGFVVVQVTNHPSTALAVLGQSRLNAHDSGRDPLELCDFLHGGRCEGDVTDTPNGEVVSGPSQVASISVLATNETSDGAWESLCGMVENSRAASMAEGFVGDLGGSTVSIDSYGFTNPCP